MRNRPSTRLTPLLIYTHPYYLFVFYVVMLFRCFAHALWRRARAQALLFSHRSVSVPTTLHSFSLLSFLSFLSFALFDRLEADSYTIRTIVHILAPPSRLDGSSQWFRSQTTDV